MSHTPGPWELTFDDLKPTTFAEVHSFMAERWIADVAPQGEKPDAEAMANARLIAAAPDLLETLDGLQEMALCAIGNRDNGPDFDRALDNLQRVAEEAAALIDKVRGRTDAAHA